MVHETKLQVGDECFFHEDMGQMKCRILERHLKDGGKELHLTLEVLKVIKRSPLVEPPREGTVFRAWKRLDYFTFALWSVTPIG